MLEVLPAPWRRPGDKPTATELRALRHAVLSARQDWLDLQFEAEERLGLAATDLLGVHIREIASSMEDLADHISDASQSAFDEGRK